MQLTSMERHAIELLADCRRVPDVARECGVCQTTVLRWKKIPEFEAAVTLAARRKLDAAGRKFDRRSARIIDAAMKAQRELIAYIAGRKALPHQRMLEHRRALDAGARTLERIRISPKAANRGELLFFMRANVNSNAISTNSCVVEVNMRNENAPTPQNCNIFEHSSPPSLGIRHAAFDTLTSASCRQATDRGSEPKKCAAGACSAQKRRRDARRRHDKSTPHALRIGNIHSSLAGKMPALHGALPRRRAFTTPNNFPHRSIRPSLADEPSALHACTAVPTPAYLPFATPKNRHIFEHRSPPSFDTRHPAFDTRVVRHFHSCQDPPMAIPESTGSYVRTRGG